MQGLTLLVAGVRMRLWVGLLVGVMLGCGGGPTPPTPSPSPPPTPAPTPTPTPEPLSPLHIVENQFFDLAGRVVELKLVAGCCGLETEPGDRGKDWGWPWADREFARQLAAAGANAVVIRLGPTKTESEGEVFATYETVDGKADLDRFYSRGWAELASLVAYYNSLGIRPVVDLIDCWSMAQSSYPHPWRRGENVQGFDGGRCDITTHGPHRYAEEFLRQAVRVLGKYAVLWTLGNEAWKCPSRIQWVQGMYDIIRDEERAQGYVVQPIGVNTQDDRTEVVGDFVDRHQEQAWACRDKPCGVTEYSTITADEFCREYRRAVEGGGFFGLWPGEMPTGEFERALTCF